MATYRCNLPHLCGRTLTLGGEALRVDAQGECTGIGEAQRPWFDAQPLVWVRAEGDAGEALPQAPLPATPPPAASDESRTPHRAKGRRQRR